MFYKKYRNDLWKAIEEAIMNPHEFRAKTADTDQFQLLRIELGDADAFHFSVKLFYDAEGERKFNWQKTSYKRGYPRPSYTESDFYLAPDFDDVIRAFRIWLAENVRRYFEDKAEQEEDSALEDLWADINLPPSSSAGPEVRRNVPFSSEEQERISKELNKLQQDVLSKVLLDGNQIQLMQERIEEINARATYLGRRDWMLAAAGALIEITIEAGLKSESASQFLKLGGETIRWIITHPPLFPV